MGTEGNQGTPAVGPGIDIRDLIAGLWRYKIMVIVVTLLAGTGGYFFASTATPKYKAVSQVLIDLQDNSYTQTSQEGAIRATEVGELDIASQVHVAQSADLARNVIAELDLTSKKQFDTLRRADKLVPSIKIALGFSANPRNQTPEQRAMGVLAGNLKVFQLTGSKTLAIEFTSTSPEIARDVVNSVARHLVDETRAAQFAPTVEATDWLGEQIDKLREKVVAAEVAVERFRTQAGLLEGQNDNKLDSEELSELNRQIVLAEAARTEAEARAELIRETLKNTGSIEGVAEVLNSPLIQRLREQQVRLRRSLADLSTTYLSNHPRIISVNRELSGLGQEIAQEAQKIANGLEQQASIARAREVSLRRSLDAVKARTSNSNINEVKLRELEREAEANRTLLENFLARHRDASARQDLVAHPGFARIISRAGLPTDPSFPKLGPIILLAGISGFFLSSGLAFMGVVFNGTAPGPAKSLPAATPKKTKRRWWRRSKTKDEADGVGQSSVRTAQPSLETKPAVPLRAPLEMGDGAIASGLSGPGAPAVSFGRQAQPVIAVTAQENPPADAVPAPADVAENPVLCSFPIIDDIAAARKICDLAAKDTRDEFSRVYAPITDWVRQIASNDRVTSIGFGCLTPDLSMSVAILLTMVSRHLSRKHSRNMIVIDAAPEGSQLFSFLDLAGDKGLAELLAGQIEPSDAILQDRKSAMHLMRTSADLDLFRQHADTQRMQYLLQSLRQTYDLVILHDGVTSFPVGTAPSFLTACDAAMVMGNAEASGAAIALCDALKEAGVLTTECIEAVSLEGFAAVQPRANEAVA